MQSAGQRVQQEATHELVGTERHRLVAGRALGAVILPAEGHAALVQAEQPAVGDGHAERIARQIREYRRWPGERTLGVNYPLALAHWREPAGVGLAHAQ